MSSFVLASEWTSSSCGLKAFGKEQRDSVIQQLHEDYGFNERLNSTVSHFRWRNVRANYLCTAWHRISQLQKHKLDILYRSRRQYVASIDASTDAGAQGIMKERVSSLRWKTCRTFHTVAAFTRERVQLETSPHKHAPCDPPLEQKTSSSSSFSLPFRPGAFAMTTQAPFLCQSEISASTSWHLCERAAQPTQSTVVP